MGWAMDISRDLDCGGCVGAVARKLVVA